VLLFGADRTDVLSPHARSVAEGAAGRDAAAVVTITVSRSIVYRGIARRRAGRPTYE
jgi:hypothetical protein